MYGYVEQAGSASPCLRVWCSWCCLWHIHGLSPDEARPGEVRRRNSHCYAPDSPWRGRTLPITVSAAPFDTVRATVREASSRQCRMIERGTITPAVGRLRAQPPPPSHLCEEGTA